jgi:hypothetical protein
MPVVASKLTRVTLDAARTIEDGESIRVQNITVANGTANNRVIEFTDATVGATAVLTLAVLANDSKSFEGNWIADKGLVVVTEGSASVVVTIMHSARGA